jgi:DnaJ-class molecular chaperone
LKEKQINSDIHVEYTIDLEAAFVGGLHNVEFPIDRDTDKIQIDLPKCVEDGHTVRFAHRGENRWSHQPRGDLYLKIKLATDDNYWFDGKTLCTKIIVDIFDAIFGATKTVTRPDGKNFSFTIEPGSQAGTKYRFKNKGYADNDFIVYLVVSTPKITNESILADLKSIEKRIKQDQEQR